MKKKRRASLESRLARNLGRSPGERVKLAGIFRAVAVLLRRYPRAAAHAAAAGLGAAAAGGVRELAAPFTDPSPAPEPKPAKLSRRDLRRFRAFLQDETARQARERG